MREGMMYIRLQKSPTSTRVQVHLVEGYRDEKGNSRQRIIRNYGVLSELEAEEPGVLERLKAEAKQMTAERKAARIMVEVDTLRPRVDGEASVNYGWWILDGLWRRLGLDKELKRIASTSKAGFDLEKITRLLVFSRILSPCSKLAAWENRTRLLFGEFDEVSLDDVYRVLDMLDAHSESVQLQTHKGVSALCGRDCGNVYYDVTNYWFETDYEDAEGEGLRAKGPSKEYRHDPIIQMGLLIDGAAIPLAYRLFRGNTHDCKTFQPALAEARARYQLGRIVVVADKGLNAAHNLAWLTGNGDGYIISQKVRGRIDPDIRKQLFNPDGWDFNVERTYATKTFLRHHQLNKTLSVEEKIVLSWSKTYADREAAKRAKVTPATRHLIDHLAAYEASNRYGRKRYIKETLTTDNGEAANKILTFNNQQVDTDAALDGYYAIITTETHLNAHEIIERYKNLANIEESFRVLKTDLDTRPVYVWTTPRINAHFLTCYLALTLLRILQQQTQNAITARQARKALTQATCTPLEKGIWIINETTPTYKTLENITHTHLPNRYATTETLRTYRQQLKTKKPQQN
jgi:transposase